MIPRKGAEVAQITEKNMQDVTCSNTIVWSESSAFEVRIHRDETFQSVIRGLYPCGEGAGYAGGIMSAAMDGLKVAEAILQQEMK